MSMKLILMNMRGDEMGKKGMNIYLDEEAVTVVRDFLEKSGQSFSGWVNAFVCEMAQDIKGQPSPLNKPVGQMTIDEFSEIAAYWWKKAKEGTSEDQEVKPSVP